MCPRAHCRAATLGFVAGSGRDSAELGKSAPAERARRVLVVDDNDATRRLIALNLELEGFEVHLAEDGQECLDVVESVDPDIITLDVVMPRLDGFATAAVLRSTPRTSGLPIVMVSACAQESDLARGRELGVEAYLTKPFDPADLVRTVRAAVRRV
jgi:DNA-binding response OmpR family regulator